MDESDASFMFQLRLLLRVLPSTVLWSPRNSTLLPWNVDGSSFHPHLLLSMRLWCAFSFTSKHSEP